MALTKNDRADIEKVRRPGASALGAKLDDAVCVALMDIIDSDLSLGLTPSSVGKPPAYFGTDPRVVRREGQPFWPFIEKASERANAAILKRWPKGLQRVKKMAWDIVSGKRQPC